MKGRAQVLAVLFVACWIVAICGCGPRASSDLPANRPRRVVNDDLGRRVVVPIVVKRVVSLAPSVTENVFAVGAGDRLVGVTTFCNYPEEAKAIAKIGDTMTPNMETIVALKPDVVLVSTASQIEAFTKTLEENQIAVYVSNPASLDELWVNLDRLGRLFGTEAAAKQVLDGLRARESQINDRLEACVHMVRPNVRYIPVFVQISKEPLFTIGQPSFLTMLICEAGGASVTAEVESAYPKLSKETAAALDPEAIILSDSEDNQGPNEAFKNSPAVRNGRVYKVNADILSRPGPRLVDALEQIAKDLHPEKFK
jgi:iron complex transport system substrate-binding protein